MLTTSWPWALFESGFLIIWRMSFLEKWQLSNFFVSKINCDSNTHLSAKKSWRFHYFLKSTMYLLKLCYYKLNILSNILKPKESPRMTSERKKRVSQPEFTDQVLQIKMVMSFLEIKILFHKYVDLKKKISDFFTF